MKYEKIIFIVGIMWLVLWLSYIPGLVYYHPFQVSQGVKSLAEEVANAPAFIKEEAGLDNKKQKELEEIVMRDLRVEWFKSISLALLGLLTALLILKKKRSGQVIALLLACGIVVSRLFIIFKTNHWQPQSVIKFYSMYFKFFPLRTIHSALTMAILIITLLLLSRPAIARQFENKRNAT